MQPKKRTLIFLMAMVMTPLVILQANAIGTVDMQNLSATKVSLQETTDARKPGKSFVAATIVDSEMDKVCQTIANYASYPSFMPNINQVWVNNESQTSAIVDMRLKLPLNTIKKYRLRMKQAVNASQCKISWKLIPWEGLAADETIADTEGYWLLTPKQDDKQATVLKYVAYTDPGEVPIGFGWIVDKMSRDGIPETIEAVRLKAKQ